MCSSTLVRTVITSCRRTSSLLLILLLWMLLLLLSLLLLLLLWHTLTKFNLSLGSRRDAQNTVNIKRKTIRAAQMPNMISFWWWCTPAINNVAESYRYGMCIFACHSTVGFTVDMSIIGVDFNFDFSPLIILLLASIGDSGFILIA